MTRHVGGGDCLRVLFVGAHLAKGGGLAIQMYQLFASVRERTDARMIILDAKGLHTRLRADPGIEVVGRLQFPAGVADLRRAIRARRDAFDVFHVFDVYYGMPAAYLARVSPRLVCFGTDPVLEMRNRYGLAGGLATAVGLPPLLEDAQLVTNSNNLATRFARFHPEVIPNGVDVPRGLPSKDEARTSLGLPTAPHILLCVSKVIPVKRLEWILEALRRVPDVHAVLVGDVREEHYGDAYYRQLTTSYADVMARTHFTGEVPWDRVQTYLAAADIFVFPSSLEGMPNAVMEAMAAALPVVASDIPAHRELLQDGKTGFLVPDVPSLVKALETLLADARLRAAVGKNALAYVASKLSIGASAERYCRVYERLVEGRHG